MTEPLFEEEPKIDVEIKEIDEEVEIKEIDVPAPEVPDIEETPVPKKRGRKKKEVVEEPVVAEEPVAPIKKERKKRVLTEEQKERLRENLKRGRETSLANRQRKKKLKEIEKAEKQRKMRKSLKI
jgi:hypothetical protein